MKHSIRKLSALLLSLCLLASVCGAAAIPAHAASVLAGGEVGVNGDNIIWTLTDDNVLTLSGTGATEDYTISHAWNEPGRRGPWWYTEYRDRVETVVVEEGITRLGDYLFSYNESLKHAILPDSLESIGKGIFENCALQELPNLGKVTVIPGSAFEYCPLTETLVVPEGITKLGNSCFKECPVKHVILPSTMRDAGEWYQFYGCPIETFEQPAGFIMAPDFEYDRLTNLVLTGPAVTFQHGRYIFLGPDTTVTIPAKCTYKGFTGLYPQMHTRWGNATYDWQYFREEVMCFNEEAMGDYDSLEAQADEAHSSFDWNFRNENYARLAEVNNPPERPIVPDENGQYYNVFGEAQAVIDDMPVTYTFVPAQDPSCSEDGNIAYYEAPTASAISKTTARNTKRSTLPIPCSPAATFTEAGTKRFLPIAATAARWAITNAPAAKTTLTLTKTRWIPSSTPRQAITALTVRPGRITTKRSMCVIARSAARRNMKPTT